MAIPPKKDSTLPKGLALTMAKTLEMQASEEPHKLHRELKQRRAQKLREMATEMSDEEIQSLRLDAQQKVAYATKVFSKKH